MTGQTLTEYRLRIRNAADSSDALVISSVRGGTNPYLASPPSGDGSSFDPLTGESMAGAYTGTIADWPIGSMQRIMTSALEDPTTFAQQLGLRRAYVEFRLNAGAWTVLTSGLLSLLRLTDAMTWEYTVSDPMRAQFVSTLFAPASSVNIMTFLASWPTRGCILGGPVIGGVMNVPDFGGWTMKVRTSGIANEYFLEPVRVYGPPNWKAQAQIGDTTWPGSTDVANAVNEALASFQIPLSDGAADSWTTIADTQTHGWAWSGVTLLISTDTGATWAPWKPLAYDYTISVDGNGIANVQNLLVSTKKGAAGIKLKSDGVRTLTNGATVKVRCLTVLPSEASPIYIDQHPIDALITFWNAVGLSYDATAATAMKNTIGADARITLRITSAENLSELVTTVCSRYGIGLRGNDSGQITPFDGRLGASNALPSVTITSADVIQDSTRLVFELDPSKALRSVTFQQKRFADMRNVRIGERGSFIDGIVVADDEFTFINEDTTSVPYGDVTLSTDGMPRGGSASAPTPVLAAQAIARRLFDRFGHGAVAMETTFIRGGAGDSASALLGDEVIVTLPQIPNHNYRLGDNPAIAGRAMQIVRRTVLPEGFAVRLVDSGPNAQPLPAVPTLTIAASSDLPRTVAMVTVTNAAALNALGYGIRFQWAVTTGGAPASTDYTDTLAFGAGLIPTAAIRLSPVDAGATVYVRARSEAVLVSRPSNYGSAANVTLSSINDPTSVIATPSGTDGSLCVLTWTPGSGATAAGDLTDIWLRRSGEAFALAVRQDSLNAGSVKFTVQGLTPGVAYIASVQHRDPHTNMVSDPVDVSFTAGATTRTLSAPLVPSGFAGSLDPVSGQPQMDGVYGLAVVAAEKPGFVEYAEAVETAVGSGAYGSFTTVATVPSVQNDWTIYQSVAPQDGLRRRIKARHVGAGLTSSSYTATVDVLPWVPVALPDISSVGLLIEVTQLTPTYPSSTFKFQVVAVDPLGGSPTVRIKTLTGTTLLSGLAVGTFGASPQTWEANLPSATSGAATATIEAALGSVTAQLSLVIPVATVLGNAQGTVSIDVNGVWSFTSDAAVTAQSFKWMASTSGYQSDGTVNTSGTGVNAPGVFSVTNGGTLAFGETIFITILPYTLASYGGVYGPSIHIRGSYLSYTATKTATYSPMALQLAPALLQSSVPEFTIGTDGMLWCAALANNTKFTSLWLFPILPNGVTIEEVSGDVYDTSSGTVFIWNFYRLSGGAITAIGSDTPTPGGGAQTMDILLGSEDTTGRSYGLLVQFNGGTTCAAGDERVGQTIITYTMPDPAVTL